MARPIPLILLLSLVAACLSGMALLYWHFSDALTHQILAYQRSLHRDLVSAVTDFEQHHPAAAWWAILSVSFGYGIFHAAGPGHGKAVIATYLSTHREAIPKGIMMSFASSFLQGVTAIVMIMVLVKGLGWVTRQAMSSVSHVEAASFAMVGVLGLWLIWRSTKKLISLKKSSGDHHCCGGHAPTPPNDWRTTLLAIASIGIRPCAGAVLLLGAASLLGNLCVGIVAVLAMSLGTALVVASIATLSVLARHWVEQIGRSHTRLHQIPAIAAWAGLIGGTIILLISLSLLVAIITEAATVTPARPF